MSREVKDYQQQILFTEIAQPAEGDEAPSGQVIFDNDSTFTAQTEESTTALTLTRDVEQPATGSKKKRRWIKFGLAILSIAVVTELVQFFIEGFTQSPILTSLYAIALGCVSLAGISGLIGEWKSLRQLKSQQDLQKEAMRLQRSQQVGEAQAFCQKVNASLPEDLSNLVDNAWYEKLSRTHTDAEIVKLYSLTVLNELDTRANAIIAKHATESALLVSLSPLALMDMFIVLWRNFKMIEQIAQQYGIRLGYRARIRLVRQVFANAIFAAGSEILMDFGLESIGAELGGKLTGNLAQGVASGLLTARLGINTVKVCRPIPFEPEQVPKISHVRKQILKEVGKLIAGVKTKNSIKKSDKP